MLSAGSEYQQQFGIGRHRLVAGRQEQFAHTLRQWRAAGLAGQQDFHAMLAQATGEVVAVGALARAFGAFEGNEQAGHAALLLVCAIARAAVLGWSDSRAVA
ncbi:hypothetical protein D3C81_907540 [compost metagenome]